jgi:hypothetical protein
MFGQATQDVTHFIDSIVTVVMRPRNGTQSEKLFWYYGCQYKRNLFAQSMSILRIPPDRDGNKKHRTESQPGAGFRDVGPLQLKREKAFETTAQQSRSAHRISSASLAGA